MSKITDLRAVSRPTMTTILPDGTVLHLCAPTVELVNEMKEGSAVLFANLRGENGETATREAVYDLTAKLINCNYDNFVTTPEALATTYGMDNKVLEAFYLDYVTFLQSLEKQKN
jgi:hypothetical protein